MVPNTELRNVINDITEIIRKKFNVKTPVDIDVVIENMGGTLVEDPNLDSFADGKIRKVSERGFEIVIPPHQSPQRRKFTIAHELGHLFLHMGYMTNIKIWEEQDNYVFYRNGNSKMERQANEFAAAFLMPKEEYEEIMNKCSDGKMVHTSEIAKYFDVSVDTASNRGKWLGLLEW